jgi:hypothetical protein
MKRIFSFAILIISLLHINVLQAQTDSSKIIKDSILIKGFYKNYQEYLNNNPSIRLNFSTKLFMASEDDSTIVRGEYTVIDTTDMFGDFWGFCDGENIFVPNGGLFQAKYWKLQSPGPNPYFFFGHRKGVLVVIPSAVIVGIMLSAGSFALPESYDLMFINDSGERLNVNEYNVKQLLKGNKTLLKKYKAEIYPTKGTMLDYILLYNESKLKN